MTKETAIHLIWDYMQLHHELKKSDVIFLLGNNDTRTAEHAAKLFHEAWAPLLVISGNGVNHENGLFNDTYNAITEAERFSKIILECGVPEDKIICESEAMNTEQNFKYMKAELDKQNIPLYSAILVQKPYMERRTFATGSMFWPDIKLIISSQAQTFEKYCDNFLDEDLIIHTIVGDLQRIKEYPKKGFQIEQEIPHEVWSAFEFLVSVGYTKGLLK